MTDESVIIEVRDGVDKNISRNLSEISSQARSAYQNVSKLVTQLNRVKPTAIAQFNSVVSNAQKQMNSAALAGAKLATEQNRTAQAATNAATAEQRLATATARTAQAQTAAAGAAMRLEAAQGRAAAAQERQAAAAAKAAAANDQAARRLAANAREVQTVTGIHDRFDAVLARNPKYQTAFAKGLADTAKNAKLSRHELNNLAFQVNDVVVGFASGQKPMTIFMQQGAQIGQIFGASGIGMGAIFRQLAGIVGTFLVKLAPLGLAVSAVLGPLSLFTREFNKGLDTNKLVSDLNLTEKQLKQLQKSGETIGITFGDTFKATFQVIGRYASAFFKPVTDKISEWWNKALDWMTNATSTFTRAVLGLFIGMVNAVKVIWNNIPAYLELAFKKAFNNAIDITEQGLSVISKAFSYTPIGQLLGLTGATEIKLPLLDFSDSAKKMESDLTGAFDAGFKRADELVDKFGKDVRAQALKNAQNRLREAAGEDDEKKKKGRSGGFDRAKELAAINAELDNQAKNMFVLADARDAANRADEIALRFAKEGKPLRDDEINAIRNKIQALNDAKEVQQQFDRIYQSVVGPQKEYNASLAAADKLLKMGVISQAQYTAELQRAEKALRDAKEPAAAMLDDIREQSRLLDYALPLREREQQLQQLRNEYIAKGLPINEKMIEQLGREIDALREKNRLQAIADEMQQNSNAQRSLNTQDRTKVAIQQIGQNGFTKGDAVTQLSQDNPALQQTQEFAQAQLAAYQDMYAQIDQLRQADVISDASAMQAKFAVFQQQSQQYLDVASGIFGNLAQLRNSDNKKAAAIGKKAAIAQALINTYTGATAAYQSAAAIPYVGWILGPIAAAAAIAAGMAQVQAIRAQNAGFMQGGYTGNIPTNAIAGPVHGKEYVFDAPATQRIGVGNLEALRRGRVPAESLMRGEGSSDASRDGGFSSDNRRIEYNQTVNISVNGRRQRDTPEQQARAIRRESTRELIRNGG